jgi:preprotein translocase subunit SecG
MQNVILVIHILACLAMIGLVLVQKSEGGGLGIGGGGANSLMSGRGAAGAIVRTTIIIGGIFFATSLALTSIANRTKGNASGIERALQESTTVAPVENPGDLFDPSVDLLGNEAAPQPQTATPELVDPSAIPAAPADEAAPAEPPPSETNPQ